MENFIAKLKRFVDAEYDAQNEQVIKIWQQHISESIVQRGSYFMQGNINKLDL